MMIMVGPLRIEFAGALYHATSHGDAQAPIYEDDGDRQQFLDILAAVVERHEWYCHAFCLMGNHYSDGVMDGVKCSLMEMLFGRKIL